MNNISKLLGQPSGECLLSSKNEAHPQGLSNVHLKIKIISGSWSLVVLQLSWVTHKVAHV